MTVRRHAAQRSPRGRRRRATGVLLATVALAAVALAACTGPATELPSDPLPPAFADGVPEPTGEVVLTVTGPGGPHDFDLPTLQQLAQHDLTVLEPFVDQEHTYAGPLWGDVLRAAGIPLDGRDVELVALDDFVTDIPADAASLDGLLLAVSEDGAPIPIADGGPLRLVFPPGNETGANLNNWIWSIRSAAAG